MFSAIESVGGIQPFNDWFAPDTTQRHVLGMKVSAVDPYWGYGEFIYLKAGASLNKGNVCVISESFTATTAPSNANTGYPVCVAMAPMSVNTFGWFQTVGLAVYAMNATVAADAAVGVAAAGVLGTNAAGKQLLGVRHLRPQTATVTVQATLTAGSPVVLTGGYDGFFVGMALSGTGVPASTVVGRLGSDGRTIYMGSAVGLSDKLATSSGQITLTGTYTGFGAGIIHNPFMQGAIT
jgi:hypothetical protein